MRQASRRRAIQIRKITGLWCGCELEMPPVRTNGARTLRRLYASAEDLYAAQPISHWLSMMKLRLGTLENLTTAQASAPSCVKSMYTPAPASAGERRRHALQASSWVAQVDATVRRSWVLSRQLGFSPMATSASRHSAEVLSQMPSTPQSSSNSPEHPNREGICAWQCLEVHTQPIAAGRIA